RCRAGGRAGPVAARVAGAAPARRPTVAAPAAAPAASSEEDDAIAANFRRVALVAVLVVPLPRLQAALDVDLLPLREVFRERFGRLAPQDDAVPLGFFLALAVLVVPDLRRRHVDRRDRSAARCVAQFGIPSEVADQNHFVD